jgi:hypothetical protein
VGGTSATVNYIAYGVATYGTIGAYVQGSITPGSATGGSIPLFINIASVGYFTDSFTINATDTCGQTACPASGPGVIQLQFLIHGTGSGPYDDCMSYQVGTSPNGLNCTPTANQFCAPGCGNGIATSGPIAITFGQPITLTIGLLTYGHISDYVDTNGGFTADYAHTAALGGFVVDNSVGTQLSNFSVTSGSGTSYANTTLPEPSTAASMALGLTAFIAVARRVRRSQSVGSGQQKLG